VTIRIDKVVAALPAPLEPNTFYAVRTGAGFDLYLTDALGQTAHKVNAPAATPIAHYIAPALLPGTFITNALNATALGTIAQQANRLEFTPFIPSRDIGIDLLSVEVSTAVAGSQARAGVYGSTAGNLPGALLSGAGTLLDCATVGAKQSAIAGGITLLAGGLYWLACHASSTQSLRALAPGALLPLGLPETGNTIFGSRRATVTFASGLPANAPATTLTAASVPRVAMRLA
jgi:hypothetical protein